MPRLPWAEILAYVIGSRLLVALVGFLSGLIVEVGKFGNHATPFVNRWIVWDATWYLGIAGNGYSYTPGEPSSVAFFPLYPLLVHVVGYVTPSLAFAGFLVSNAALFGACVLLWKLIEEDALESDSRFEPGDGRRAVLPLVLGPVSFFFSIAYSESTFLFFTVACVYGARRKQWWFAGAAGLAAALTRNAGVLLTIPLLLEWFEVRLSKPFFKLPTSWKPLAACAMPATGIGLWMAYLWMRFGDPLILLKVQQAWGRRLSWPWEPFKRRYLWNFPEFHQYWFVGCAAIVIIVVLSALWLRLRPTYLALALAMLLLNLGGLHLEAIPRLLSVIFPAYLALAIWFRRYPRLETFWLAASSALLALSTTLFCNGYWFT